MHIASYRSAVSRDHTRSGQRPKRRRIGNDIDLNDINPDLVYVSYSVDYEFFSFFTNQCSSCFFKDEHQTSIEELVHRFDTDLKTVIYYFRKKFSPISLSHLSNRRFLFFQGFNENSS